MKLTSLFLCIFLIGLGIQVKSQQIITGDSVSTVEEEKIHSPKKAALFSAVVPGLGQIYNKKYWKLPIVYGGIGTSVYFIVRNTVYYNDFLDGYLAKIDGDELTIDTYPGLTQEELFSNVQTVRSWLEWSYVATLGIYLLQIVDATVDAHLFNFDVSDDLSMNIRSIAIPTQNSLQAGISISLNF